MKTGGAILAAVVVVALLAAVAGYMLTPRDRVYSLVIVDHPSVGTFTKVVGVEVLAEERVYEDLSDYTLLGRPREKRVYFRAPSALRAVETRVYARGVPRDLLRTDFEKASLPKPAVEVGYAEFRPHQRFLPVVLKTDAAIPDAYQVPDLGEVEDQGPCGSCSAFATAHSAERAVGHPDISEQWLLDCNPWGYSCDGGWWYHDMLLKEHGGVVHETDAPYVAYVQECVEYPQYDWVEGYTEIPYDLDAIKLAIMNYGPVATAICVNEFFSAWSDPDAVFEQEYGCGVYEPANHAVVLAGWDDSMGRDGAFLLKNSWGEHWNQGGYIWISYGIWLHNTIAVNDEPMPPPPDPTTATVTIDSGSMGVGNALDTEIRVEDLFGASAWQVVLYYDESIVEPTAVEWGTFFNEPDVIELGPVIEKGYIAIARVDLNMDEYEGDGLLATITWEALGEGITTLDFADEGDEPPQSYFLDRHHEHPPAVFVDGSITVGDEVTPTPTDTPTPVPTGTPEHSWRVVIPGFDSMQDAEAWLEPFEGAYVEKEE
jgi:hypothetical protein